MNKTKAIELAQKCGAFHYYAGIDFPRDTLEAFYAAAQKEVIDRLTAGVELPIPSATQLLAIFRGLENCHIPESKTEYLRVWILDWTRHKLIKYGAAQRLLGAKEERDRCVKVCEKVGVGARRYKSHDGEVVRAIGQYIANELCARGEA